MKSKLFLLGLMGAMASLAFAQGTSLNVEVGSSRSAADIGLRIDAASRAFARNLATLTAGARAQRVRAGLYDPSIPFSMPTVARVTSFGKAPVGGPLAFGVPRGRGANPITLVFDTTGPRTFSPSYQAQLQAVLTSGRSTIDLVFGQPSVGGNVRVRNYDADIGDRDAVAGGVFLPDNGFGEAEIRFPVYTNPEATAVNFLHTLLLAYLGPNSYAFDAFQEGLVRAGTMRIARTPGAMPAGLFAAQIEQVLENSYDTGSFYDWYNQRPLGGPRFIAANLVNVPLPAGGSLGGIYLLRYMMAGSSWQKVLVEYPGFASAFNQGLYASPGLRNDVPGLIVLGQSVIDAFGGPSSMIEGLPFGEWFQRQFILETRLTFGPKLLVQPVPITSGLGGSDYGVFDVQATYFDTLANGDETLLSGLSFPIFWENAFNRVFPSTQEDRMDIAGAYGSVAPNFPNLQGGAPYRVAIDIPVQDRMARAYVPAGSIATPANPDPSDFYGTVVGLGLTGADTARVRLSFGATTLDTIPVQNGAFGVRIGTGAYLGNQRLLVEVIRTSLGLDTTVLTRRVNKGPGPLALDLRVMGDGSFSQNLPKGISLLGLPLDPFVSAHDALLGIPEAQVLAARYNQARAAYDLFPTLSPMQQGHAQFLRMPATQSGFTVAGRLSAGTPIAVALRPGWNMISNPLNETVPISRVRVVRAANFPRSFIESLGTDIGTDFFTFQPGPNDTITGAPETGTMVAATQFEPGKGYFVRVLAPEGVTLLFVPQTPLTRERQSMALQTPDGWSMRLIVTQPGFATDVIVGQRRNGSAAYNPREDSAVPPGVGGFQAWVAGVEPMYRDVRRSGDEVVYRVGVAGLRPGAWHAVKFEPLDGRLYSFKVTDTSTGQTRRYQPGFTYQFRARSDTHQFELAVSPRDVR